MMIDGWGVLFVLIGLGLGCVLLWALWEIASGRTGSNETFGDDE